MGGTRLSGWGPHPAQPSPFSPLPAGERPAVRVPWPFGKLGTVTHFLPFL